MRARHRSSSALSLLVFAAALVAGGCSDTPTAPTSALRDEFVLAPGTSAALSDGSGRVTFTAVTGDSRCPGDAICIQGGDAIVRIDVETSRGRRAHDLHTGSMAPVSHDDLTITLVELMPYPFSSMPFPYEAYRATLRVTRPGR